MLANFRTICMRVIKLTKRSADISKVTSSKLEFDNFTIPQSLMCFESTIIDLTLDVMIILVWLTVFKFKDDINPLLFS